MQVQTNRRLLSKLGRFRLKFGSPMLIVCGFLVLVLAYLILVPLGHMLRDSLTWQLADTRLSREAVPGELTIFHWTRVLSSEITQFMFYSPLRNTLLTGLIGSLLAIFIEIGRAHV